MRTLPKIEILIKDTFPIINQNSYQIKIQSFNQWLEISGQFEFWHLMQNLILISYLNPKTSGMKIAGKQQIAGKKNQMSINHRHN